MPEFLKKLLQQFTEFWNNLEKSQKIRIYITAGILAVAVAVGIFLISKPSYVTIIDNAEAKDLAEMQNVLKGKKISYKLTDSKNGIMVNLKDSDAARLELVSAGYPKDGMTFVDALNNIKINTTESDKKHIWKELSKSDIIRLLKKLESVDDANVMITTPESNLLFVDKNDQTRPTAAVYITPKRDTLTQKEVQGIVMLVARSIEGLDPKDITIVDNNGNILNSETGDQTIDTTSNQYDMKQKVKADLEKSARDMLNGPFDSFDSIRVKVNPVLDFDKLKSNSKEIANPTGMDNGALISRDSTKEKLNNGTVGGAPGTDTNPGTANSPSYPTGSNGNSTYDKQHDISNWGYNETSKEQEKALGEVIPDKTTAAVTLLFGNRVKDASKITPQFIAQVQQIVSNATGIPLKNVSVSTLKTIPPEVPVKSLNDTIKDLLNTYGLFTIMLLLVIGLMIAIIPKKKKIEEPELASEAALAGATASGPKFIVPDMSNDAVPEIAMEERSEVKKQIEKFVKQKPDAVAQLLRNWLSDDWE